MRVKKVFNNNVVLIEDQTQTELVVMGKGLAFQKKIGDEIDTDKIEKTFITPSESFANKLTDLIDEIPYELLVLSKDIVDMTSEDLQTELSDSLYLTLADHIHFAIVKVKDNLHVRNPLSWEVQKFYKEEYKVARKALSLIEEKTTIKLPEDETTSIALHLFNARQDSSGMEETMAMTEIVRDVMSIVKYHYGIEFDEESMNFSRFITHVRYFAYRMLRGELNEEEHGEALFQQVKSQYPDAYKCAKKVQAYLNKEHQMEMTKDELAYFMIHIHRVSSREKIK